MPSKGIMECGDNQRAAPLCSLLNRELNRELNRQSSRLSSRQRCDANASHLIEAIYNFPNPKNAPDVWTCIRGGRRRGGWSGEKMEQNGT